MEDVTSFDLFTSLLSALGQLGFSYKPLLGIGVGLINATFGLSSGTVEKIILIFHAWETLVPGKMNPTFSCFRTCHWDGNHYRFLSFTLASSYPIIPNGTAFRVFLFLLKKEREKRTHISHSSSAILSQPDNINW